MLFKGGGGGALSQQGFTLALEKLGPKEAQDLRKSRTKRSSPQPVPRFPQPRIKARLEPTPDPWVTLGGNGLSPGLGLPEVGRAQTLAHSPYPPVRCLSRGQTRRGQLSPSFLSQRLLGSWEEAPLREGQAPVTDGGCISSAPAAGHHSPLVRGLRDSALTQTSPHKTGSIVQELCDPHSPSLVPLSIQQGQAG